MSSKTDNQLQFLYEKFICFHWCSPNHEDHQILDEFMPGTPFFELMESVILEIDYLIEHRYDVEVESLLKEASIWDMVKYGKKGLPAVTTFVSNLVRRNATGDEDLKILFGSKTCRISILVEVHKRLMLHGFSKPLSTNSKGIKLQHDRSVI